MATVSFDFDHTIFDEENHCFISETVSILRDHIEAGDRVIIVTSRIKRFADEARDLILKHLNLDLEVFSAPGNADDWRDSDPTKSDILITQSAIKHFDDLVNCSSLLLAKNTGIEIVLPPATKASIASCY